MTVHIGDLYFGCADGDIEAKNAKFINIFYKGNNKYDEVISNQMKFIIMGKKGTGKTILSRYIEETQKENGVLCKVFNKNDITLGKLIEKKQEILSRDEAVHMFKWIIYREIYRMLTNYNFKRINKKNIKDSNKTDRKIMKNVKTAYEYKKSIRRLRKLFNQRYPEGNYEFIDYISTNEFTAQGEAASTLNSKKNKLKFSNILQFSKRYNYTRKHFCNVIEEVERHLMICLKWEDVVVILDDLDEIEVNIENEKSPLIAIEKLIEAFKDINTRFYENGIHRSRCILLVRSDIMEVLNRHSSNLNKVIEDNTVELYWIKKEKANPEDHMLMDMILSKIRMTCEEYKDFDNKTLYKKVFPTDVNGISLTKFLIDRSFGRPRDIIRYLNIVSKAYSKKTLFTGTMFRDCINDYSQAFLKELYNEMRIHIDIKILDEYLELLRSFGRNSFYPNEIESFLKKNKGRFKNIKNMDHFYKTLYSFGVIGNAWRKDEKKSESNMQYSWGYRKDGNPNINKNKKISVHYGLRSALNL